jgi:hypothetical protein
MKITKVEIENFKKFQSISFSFGNMNILAGETPKTIQIAHYHHAVFIHCFHLFPSGSLFQKISFFLLRLHPARPEP